MEQLEKSVLQANSFNFPNCVVSTCGSQLNKVQINLLMKYCKPKEICICFDREEKRYETEYYNKLYNLCQKYKMYAKMSFLYYGMKDLLNMKDSPFDRGQETFEKLFKQRSFI